MTSCIALQGTKKKPPKKPLAVAEATYDVSRYAPPLKRVMEDALSSGWAAAHS